MAQKTDRELYTRTFFARQPVFTRAESLWGYEFFYRDSLEAESANIADSHLATLDVAASAFGGQMRDSHDASRVLLTFTEQALLEEVPLALPSGLTVVKLHEPDVLTDELLSALQHLRAEGYMLALDGFSAQPSFKDLYRKTDIFILDALSLDSFDMKRMMAAAREFPGKVLAKRVEDREHYAELSAIGVDLYQGFFFQKPVNIPGRKLSSNEVSRLNLLRLLERTEPDFNELAAMVQTDVSISYRLLAYLNSAAFSFPQKIHSIKQAVVILGWTTVRNWLRLIILTDMVPHGKSPELVFISAIRGKFLEKTCIGHTAPGCDAGGLFLLGLFSLLDALLDMPMADVLDNVPLETEIKNALCGHESRYAPWLDLARCFENGNWEKLDADMQELRLDPLVVARCYYDSLLWANSFFGFRPGS